MALIATSTFGAVSSASADTNPDWIWGVDLGMLAEVEDKGGQFFQDGVEGDAVEILADAGSNMVRLRLWVDPYTMNGEPYGGGTNDLASTIVAAQRAKAEGMDVLLDFHLSDWWADPGTQTKPKAWRNLTSSQLVTTVHDYTEDVITQMRAAGVVPEMVQMGNEISAGVLWDEGRIGGAVTDFGPLAELLTAGFDGVDDALLPGEDIEKVLHIDHGGDNNLYRWWFDGILAEGVDFDIIGLSYYPFWHGTMGELKYNLNDLASRFGKELLVVETAYGWTLDDGDGLINSFYTAEEATGGYPATVAGQTAYLRDLRDIVQGVPGGLGRGIIWWEPAWLPVEGAHWGSEAGKEDNDDGGILSNPWDNQTLFDFDGNALSTLGVFSETPGQSVLSNGSFDVDGWTSTPSSWTVWGTGAAVYTQDPAVHGGFKLTHWSASPYAASTYQQVPGIQNGTYDLTAWVLNSGGQNTAELYVKGHGGTDQTVDLPVSTTSWTKISIDDVTVTSGWIEVGVYSDANAGNWINVDDVRLVPSS
ncbi:arabinogalactan endo-beta-1,4-galactanase [Cellulosimicrobium cellulans]|uniref:glycoside hydrolase family 53 protein n=1 Tax=Cellulosimicrobium cellulans TaxID=1710 RepID=UPI0036E93FEB